VLVIKAIESVCSHLGVAASDTLSHQLSSIEVWVQQGVCQVLIVRHLREDVFSQALLSQKTPVVLSVLFFVWTSFGVAALPGTTVRSFLR